AAANQTTGGVWRNTITGGDGNDVLQGGFTQVVLLDFDTETQATEWHYTAAQRDAIQARMQADYAAFDVVFTQSAAAAKTLAVGTGGLYATLFFNKGNPGGASDEIDFRNLNPGGTSAVNAVGLLGGPDPATSPPLTEANVIALSATIAAHELGHLMGLRHGNGFGPIGSGIYAALAGSFGPQSYSPAYAGPAAAAETARHLM